jgi:hypothetical protein
MNLLARRWSRRGLGSLALAAALVTVLMVSASQAGASVRDKPAKSGDNKYVKVTSGSDAVGATDTVDGVPASKAAGTFDQGTAQTSNTGAVAPLIAASAPSGCKDAQTNWQAGTNVFGQTVWKIWNHTHWCFNNWTVTSVTGWTDVFTAPGWSAQNKTWGWSWWNQPSTARTAAKTHFCLVSYFGCIQSADPVVNTWVNGAGNWSWDGSNWYP